jgi:hypothetical protein
MQELLQGLQATENFKVSWGSCLELPHLLEQLGRREAACVSVVVFIVIITFGGYSLMMIGYSSPYNCRGGWPRPLNTFLKLSIKFASGAAASEASQPPAFAHYITMCLTVGLRSLCVSIEALKAISSVLIDFNQ